MFCPVSLLIGCGDSSPLHLSSNQKRAGWRGVGRRHLGCFVIHLSVTNLHTHTHTYKKHLLSLLTAGEGEGGGGRDFLFGSCTSCAFAQLKKLSLSSSFGFWFVPCWEWTPLWCTVGSVVLWPLPFLRTHRRPPSGQMQRCD